MSKIRVNRYQYGVGQGCFHAQEISVDAATYRLVYDCGGREEDLDWCISHFTNQAQDQKINKKTVIDTFYLSHFEEDHLNGLKKLAEKADIKKIVLPYIDKNDVLTLIAQQIFTYNSISSAFIEDLTKISQGESISGLDGIPIIQVQPNDGLPPPVDETVTDNPDVGGGQITDDLTAKSQKIGNKRITLSSKIAFWELLHWAYKPLETSSLSYLVVEQLKLKFDSIPDKINQLCEWLPDNHIAIKEAYQAAINIFNNKNPTNQVKPQSNHNIVSLCLYSGPLNRRLEHYNSNNSPHWWPSWHFCGCFKRKYQFKDCICGIRLGAWIGTGDAMLGLDDVWNGFKTYFGKRLDLCATVLIPHHGAGAKSSHNYRGEVVQHNRNCVISAGANNRYRHPHKDVLIDILSRSGRVIIVNENDKLGFIEQVEFS